MSQDWVQCILTLTQNSNMKTSIIPPHSAMYGQLLTLAVLMLGIALAPHLMQEVCSLLRFLLSSELLRIKFDGVIAT